MGIYIREYFPQLHGFLRAYAKEEGSISEEASLSIQGNVDANSLQATLG